MILLSAILIGAIALETTHDQVPDTTTVGEILNLGGYNATNAANWAIGRYDSTNLASRISAKYTKPDTGIPMTDLKSDLQQTIYGKQDQLVAGQNIKTINNQSILGSGNITIEGGGSGGTSNYNLLSNKPKINGVELAGNKSLIDIGAQKIIADYTTTNAAERISANSVTNNVAAWAMKGKAEPVTDLSSRTTFEQATNIVGYVVSTNTVILKDPNPSSLQDLSGRALIVQDSSMGRWYEWGYPNGICGDVPYAEWTTYTVADIYAHVNDTNQLHFTVGGRELFDQMIEDGYVTNTESFVSASDRTIWNAKMPTITDRYPQVYNSIPYINDSNGELIDSGIPYGTIVRYDADGNPGEKLIYGSGIIPTSNSLKANRIRFASGSGTVINAGDVGAATSNEVEQMIGRNISNTNPAFSNAVLTVGLGISTNEVATIKAMVASFSDYPIGTGATTIGALLLALAGAVTWLKKHTVKTDGETTQSVSGELIVGSLNVVGGTKFAIVSSASEATASDTLYFITGSSS